MNRLLQKTSLIIICISSLFATNPSSAGETDSTISYVEIDPVIVTNFLRAKGKKPGFVQLQAQITVSSAVAYDAVDNNMPLIRDTIVEFLSFTDEATIKDISQRKKLRENLNNKIKEALKKVLGSSYAEDLIITHFMWG